MHDSISSLFSIFPFSIGCHVHNFFVHLILLFVFMISFCAQKNNRSIYIFIYKSVFIDTGNIDIDFLSRISNTHWMFFLMFTHNRVWECVWIFFSLLSIFNFISAFDSIESQRNETHGKWRMTSFYWISLSPMIVAAFSSAVLTLQWFFPIFSHTSKKGKVL